MLAEARTLVVEDEAMIALDLQNMLKNLGYDVSDPASSGAEVLALATVEIDQAHFFWAWIFTKTAKPGGDCSHVTRRARWLIGYLGENGD